MKINISTGERAELVAPGASYTGCAIHIATEGRPSGLLPEVKEAARNVCEVTIEHGLVTKVVILERDGSHTVVATRGTKS